MAYPFTQVKTSLQIEVKNQAISSQGDFCAGENDSGGASLGTRQNHRHLPNGAASRPSNVDENGVIIDALPDKFNQTRQLAYNRRNAARHLLPKERVAWCGRRIFNNLHPEDGKVVHLVKSLVHGKVSVHGVGSCNSPWNCPTCSAKIAARRVEKEILPVMNAHKAEGHACLLVTFTAPHTRQDKLDAFTDAISKALSRFYENASFKGKHGKESPNCIKSRWGWMGRVRGLETTHGDENGWHSHFHEIWFMERELTQEEMMRLKLEIYVLWVRMCERSGLGTPSLEHGVDVQDGNEAGKYVAKLGNAEKKGTNWGMEHEVAKGNLKKGKGNSRSPFQLLDDFMDGDKQAGALFLEYTKAFKRRHLLSWSKGMLSMYNIKEHTDEELMALEEDIGERVISLTKKEWKLITRTPKGLYVSQVPTVLELAEYGGVDAVKCFIDGYSIRKKRTTERAGRNDCE